MTFDERYGEDPDFWQCLHDMENIGEHLRDEGNSIHVHAAIWAIRWIAHVDDHRSFSALYKLWDNMIERENRLPPIVTLPPPTWGDGA
jgi:hypothetical protein